MQKPKRSRVVEGSCWRCRKLRIKCDTKTPACSRCEQENQECGYGAPPFRFVGGTALRGKNTIQQHTPSEVVAPRRKSSTTNTGFGRPPTSKGNVSHGLILSKPLKTSMDETTLLPYFAGAIIPRFLVGNETMAVDLGTITRDLLLQRAIVAVAQSHHDMVSKPSVRNSLVREHSRQTALASFRKRLETDSTEGNAQELFITNILFCIMDGMIVPSGEPQTSAVHLQGGYAMLKSWSNVTTSMVLADGLHSHMLSIFVTMDLVYAVLSGHRPYFDASIFDKFANTQAWWGRLSENDRLLAAFKTFSGMALRASMIEELPDNNAHITDEESIPPISSHVSKAGPHAANDSAAKSDPGWSTFCSMYELSTVLYRERALRLRSIDAEVVQSCVKRGVSVLSNRLLPGMMQHCLVLPILVIGAHAVDMADRRAIVEALAPTVSHLSFGNLPIMMDFLKTTWKINHLDMPWRQLFADIAGKVFLF